MKDKEKNVRLIDADLIHYEPMLSARGNGNYEEVMVAYEHQIDCIPTVEPQHWIPCGEKVDLVHEVLCCDKDGRELIGHLSYCADQWMCTTDRDMLFYVEAWMPLPEPYKGE